MKFEGMPLAVATTLQMHIVVKKQGIRFGATNPFESLQTLLIFFVKRNLPRHRLASYEPTLLPTERSSSHDKLD